MGPIDPFFPDLSRLSRALSPHGQTPLVDFRAHGGNTALAELAWDFCPLLPVIVLSRR
jgi:hypothetical protein